MTMQPNPTLDQLQIFLAVADTGSFSGAARKLNRAQSVVSYAIANLEAQLEVGLFDRSRTREPQLTEAGEAMLADARRVVAGLQTLRARAIGLKQGLEGEVRAAIDVTISSHALVFVLKAFETEFPTVSLRLQAGSLGVVADLVERGEVDVGIGGTPLKHGDVLVLKPIGGTTMFPVAAPGHPLAQVKGPVPLSVVREHTQLVVTDLSDRTKGRDFNVYAYNIWRMTDLGMKHTLLKAGLGWGGLPELLVRHDLIEGRLVRLDLEPYQETNYPIFAITAPASPPGPAATWLIDAFRDALVACTADAIA
jgi:DNA-binding transcriptional LysR family regulator